MILTMVMILVLRLVVTVVKINQKKKKSTAPSQVSVVIKKLNLFHCNYRVLIKFFNIL